MDFEETWRVVFRWMKPDPEFLAIWGKLVSRMWWWCLREDNLWTDILPAGWTRDAFSHWTGRQAWKLGHENKNHYLCLKRKTQLFTDPPFAACFSRENIELADQSESVIKIRVSGGGRGGGEGPQLPFWQWRLILKRDNSESPDLEFCLFHLWRLVFYDPIDPGHQFEVQIHNDHPLRGIVTLRDTTHPDHIMQIIIHLMTVFVDQPLLQLKNLATQQIIHFVPSLIPCCPSSTEARSSNLTHRLKFGFEDQSCVDRAVLVDLFGDVSIADPEDECWYRNQSHEHPVPVFHHSATHVHFLNCSRPLEFFFLTAPFPLTRPLVLTTQLWSDRQFYLLLSLTQFPIHTTPSKESEQNYIFGCDKMYFPGFHRPLCCVPLWINEMTLMILVYNSSSLFPVRAFQYDLFLHKNKNFMIT